MTNKRSLLRETNTIFLNGVFFKNPVLVGALGLYPVVAAGYNMKNAVELSLLFLFISLPVALLFCLVGEMLPVWIRPGLVLAASAMIYLPAAWLTDKLIPGAVTALGMFASLMICNSVVLSRANDYAPTHIGWAVAADAVGCSVGFSLVICLSAAIREFWLKGSLWHTNMGVYGTADAGVSLPFFGFILLGFFAAFVQWANEKRGRKAEKRRVPRV
nr:Rnf-Nqr domain containing protein [uncultured Caproiciproducens sp.]